MMSFATATLNSSSSTLNNNDLSSIGVVVPETTACSHPSPPSDVTESLKEDCVNSVVDDSLSGLPISQQQQFREAGTSVTAVSILTAPSPAADTDVMMVVQQQQEHQQQQQQEIFSPLPSSEPFGITIGTAPMTVTAPLHPHPHHDHAHVSQTSTPLALLEPTTTSTDNNVTATSTNFDVSAQQDELLHQDQVTVLSQHHQQHQQHSPQDQSSPHIILNHHVQEITRPTSNNTTNTHNNNNNNNNHNTNQSHINKWSKNGYGQTITPTPSGGKFTPAESLTVKKAIQTYCTQHEITPSRLCSEQDNRSDHLKGAWMDIAKKVPHRTVQSVYRHGLRLMHPFKRGAWSEKEASLLLELVLSYGKKWSAIQSKLNRSADSCRDKYREFSKDYEKGRWKDDETELLKKYIRECLNADDGTSMEEMVKMVEEKKIVLPWSNISKKMGKRSRLSCFKRWQKITGMGRPIVVHDKVNVGEILSTAATSTSKSSPPKTSTIGRPSKRARVQDGEVEEGLKKNISLMGPSTIEPQSSPPMRASPSPSATSQQQQQQQEHQQLFSPPTLQQIAITTALTHATATITANTNNIINANISTDTNTNNPLSAESHLTHSNMTLPMSTPNPIQLQTQEEVNTSQPHHSHHHTLASTTTGTAIVPTDNATIANDEGIHNVTTVTNVHIHHHHHHHHAETQSDVITYDSALLSTIGNSNGVSSVVEHDGDEHDDVDDDDVVVIDVDQAEIAARTVEAVDLPAL